MSETGQETPGVTATLSGTGGGTAEVDSAAVAAAAAEANKDDTLLAGKYKTTEDLEKAYAELEKKLGSTEGTPKEETPAEETTEEETTEEETGEKPKEAAEEGSIEEAYGKPVADAITAAGIDIEAATKAFTDEGTLTDEMFESFENAGFPKAVVDAYLRGVSGQSEAAAEVHEAQITKIKGVAGGDEGYAKLQEFIRGNYTAAEAAEYNEAIGSGDFETAFTAVHTAGAKMTAAFGSEETPTAGKSASAVQGYASEAEWMADMKKTEYNKDPAFRANVEKRLARSTGW